MGIVDNYEVWSLVGYTLTLYDSQQHHSLCQIVHTSHATYMYIKYFYF